MTICPSCGKGELIELVPGVMNCSSCRKMFRGEIQEEVVEKAASEMEDGEFFMKNTALNPKWEMADKGITVARERNKWWIAVVMCHSPNFPNIKYLRISWWKKSVNVHGGMFKIDSFEELDNILIALERIDNDFDENFNPKDDHQISFDPIPERANIEEKLFEFNIKKRICPKCKWKMKKSRNKRYYECEQCGEIIVLDEGHPIYDYPSEALPLNYSTNYPVNFYLPSYGISVRSTMGDWKAIVTIFAKENPEKKWLRFYWWQRNLQRYMTSNLALGNTQGLRWETKKGVMSPNIYEKEQVRLLIDALKTMKLEWQKVKGIDPEKAEKEAIAKRESLSTSSKSKVKTGNPSDPAEVPYIRTKKVDIVHWLLANDETKEFTKKELVRMRKPELINVVNKIAARHKKNKA